MGRFHGAAGVIKAWCSYQLKPLDMRICFVSNIADFGVTLLSVVVVGWVWGADVTASDKKGDVRVQ